MNLTTFKTKLLMFLSARNQEQGKVSISIIVIGILVLSVALYFFWIDLQAKQAQQRREMMGRGRACTGATVRAQQAYRLEHTSFAPTFADLKFDYCAKDTPYHTFKITAADEKSTRVTATALKPDLKSFAGEVIADTTGTRAMYCQTTGPSNIPPIPDAANQKCITGELMN